MRVHRHRSTCCCYAPFTRQLCHFSVWWWWLVFFIPLPCHTAVYLSLYRLLPSTILYMPPYAFLLEHRLFFSFLHLSFINLVRLAAHAAVGRAAPRLATPALCNLHAYRVVAMTVLLLYVYKPVRHCSACCERSTFYCCVHSFLFLFHCSFLLFFCSGIPPFVLFCYFCYTILLHRWYHGTFAGIFYVLAYDR